MTVGDSRAVKRCWRRGALVWLLVAVVLSGCGGGGDDRKVVAGGTSTISTAAGDVTTTVAASTPTGRATAGGATSRTGGGAGAGTPTSDPSSAPGSSPLGRRDVPSPGVVAQFEEKGIGDPPCQNLPTAGSRAVEVWPSAGEGVRLGEFIFICVPGFTPFTPVDVWLTFPDGRVEQRVANEFLEDPYNKENGIAFLHWFTVPGHPLGRYQLTASKAGEKASGEFVLVPAERETITVFPDDLVSTATGRPGKTFNIGFVGFRPNAHIDFLIFHQPRRGGTYTFVTGLSTQADGAGQTVYRLATSSGDVTGRYCVLLPHQVPRPDADLDGHPCSTYFGDWFELTG